MKTLLTRQTKSGKYSKISARMSIFILSVLIIMGLVLFPMAVSIAQIIDPLEHPRYLPLLLKYANLGPTYTNTPTGTLPTPTITPSTTPVPTFTFTPYLTLTGTITPIPGITISVAPTSGAKVNEVLTFTITVKNTGTSPTYNNSVFDNFPVSYIDVTDVSTSKGTYVKQSRSFIVTIGDIIPNEVVTITAKVKVNSSLPTTTVTNTNLVTLTYDNGASKTASCTYIVKASSLPGTGELPLNWREEKIKPLALIPGIIIMVLGGASLVLVALWAKARQPKIKLWMTVGGALLILIGFAVGLTGSGLISPTQQVQEAFMTPTLSGIIAQGQPSATILPHRPASSFSTPDNFVPLTPIVTLPDFPIPTPEITVTPQPGEIGPDTSAITRIVIPAIQLDTEVKYVPYDGFTWLITGLRQEVAWMGDTSWPGLGSNTGLAGHVTVAGMGDGPFRHLDELPNGELVLLYTEKNIYTYQVRDSLVTDDGDLSVIAPTDNPQISLITCVDWDEATRTYLNRLVVIADLVRTDSITIGRAP